MAGPDPSDSGVIAAETGVPAAADAGVASADAAEVAQPPPLPDAPTVDATVAIPTALATRPPVKGPAIRVQVKQKASVGGVVVELLWNSHKHPAGPGNALGMWGFRLSRGKAVAEVELRSEDSGFQAEIEVAGAVLVLEHVSYDEFAVVLASTKAAAPLSEDACADQVEAKAVAARLPSNGSRSSSTENGVFVLHDGAGWAGYCGLYTRRIWFAAREDR